ncbi:MAG TPA: glycosyltransferase [Patescibacteria group bacterium]
MMKKTRVVNLIPTYNEKENILLMIEKVEEVAKKYRQYDFVILIVDDNSPDGTGKIVATLQKKYSNIVLLTHKKEGLGKAMIRGIKYTLKHLKADILIINEADFAYNPEKMPFMIKKITEDGYDVVVASRHVGNGGTKGWTVGRTLNHWFANYVCATWLAGTRQVYDHNGAFRAIRIHGVLDAINFDGFKTRGFGFFNYFLFKLTQVTNNFFEFPVTYQFRTRGESKVSFNPKYFKTYLKDVLEYLKICLAIRLERWGVQK